MPCSCIPRADRAAYLPLDDESIVQDERRLSMAEIEADDGHVSSRNLVRCDKSIPRPARLRLGGATVISIDRLVAVPAKLIARILVEDAANRMRILALQAV